MPVENTSITISDEKKALNRSETTSAWRASRNAKASRNSPNNAAQNSPLKITTRESRSREPTIIERIVSQTSVARSRRNSRASASSESSRTPVAAAARPLMAGVRGGW